VRSYTAKLHVDMVVVVLVYQLKVLDRGLVDSSIKIEDESLHLFVPLGWLVEEEHNSLSVIDLELFLY